MASKSGPRAKRITNPPIVEVTWEDAESDHGWEPSADTDMSPAMAVTVGFLIKDESERVVIASTCDAQNNSNNRLKIPRGMIRSMRKIGT
jgi:hypothetical protein